MYILILCVCADTQEIVDSRLYLGQCLLWNCGTYYCRFCLAEKEQKWGSLWTNYCIILFKWLMSFFARFRTNSQHYYLYTSKRLFFSPITFNPTFYTSIRDEEECIYMCKNVNMKVEFEMGQIYKSEHGWLNFLVIMFSSSSAF